MKDQKKSHNGKIADKKEKGKGNDKININSKSKENNKGRNHKIEEELDFINTDIDRFDPKTENNSFDNEEDSVHEQSSEESGDKIEDGVDYENIEENSNQENDSGVSDRSDEQNEVENIHNESDHSDDQTKEEDVEEEIDSSDKESEEYNTIIDKNFEQVRHLEEGSSSKKIHSSNEQRQDKILDNDLGSAKINTSEESSNNLIDHTDEQSGKNTFHEGFSSREINRSEEEENINEQFDQSDEQSREKTIDNETNHLSDENINKENDSREINLLYEKKTNKKNDRIDSQNDSYQIRLNTSKQETSNVTVHDLSQKNKGKENLNYSISEAEMNSNTFMSKEREEQDSIKDKNTKKKRTKKVYKRIKDKKGGISNEPSYEIQPKREHPAIPNANNLYTDFNRQGNPGYIFNNQIDDDEHIKRSTVFYHKNQPNTLGGEQTPTFDYQPRRQFNQTNTYVGDPKEAYDYYQRERFNQSRTSDDQKRIFDSYQREQFNHTDLLEQDQKRILHHSHQREQFNQVNNFNNLNRDNKFFQSSQQQQNQKLFPQYNIRNNNSSTITQEGQRSNPIKGFDLNEREIIQAEEMRNAHFTYLKDTDVQNNKSLLEYLFEEINKEAKRLNIHRKIEIPKQETNKEISFKKFQNDDNKNYMRRELKSMMKSVEHLSQIEKETRNEQSRDSAEEGFDDEMIKEFNDEMFDIKDTAAGRFYVCPKEFCRKKFPSLSRVKRHFLVHDGRKPFKCLNSNCEKTFSRKDNMMQHYRAHCSASKRQRKQR